MEEMTVDIIISEPLFNGGFEYAIRTEDGKISKFYSSLDEAYSEVFGK